MSAHINIVHKLYDRKGDVSGYMVKNGYGAPDEYRVYDAEGNFLYGIVDCQPWTVFRILDRDGRLIYVGLTRSKHLKKGLGQLDVSGALLKEEYPSPQQAEDAEKRYVRQMFPKSKYGLSTSRRQKFGPHKGTRKYIVNPQASGKRKGKVYMQQPPSKQYIHKAHTAITCDVNEGVGWRPVHPRVNDQRALFTGYYRTRDTLMGMFKSPEQRRREQIEDARKEKPKHQRKTVVKALRPRGWKKAHRFERCVYCSGERPWRSKWPGAAQLRLFDDEPYRSHICPDIIRRPLPSRKGVNSRMPGKVGGFRWGGRMGLRDGYSLKAPDAVHLPKKLVDPRVRTEAIAAAEVIRNVKDERKKIPAPSLVSSVFKNVAPYYIGRWSALKRDEARQVGPSEGKYEGLNEILAEVDGERLEHDIVSDPRVLRRLEEDPAFKALWVEHWTNKAVDATSDDPSALPWVEAYLYVGEMLEREKLSREDQLAVGLQLSKLLKRLRQRGSLNWTATDGLPNDEVPKRGVVDQNRAAELCGVSPRTIKSVEDIYGDPKPYTPRTLRKIYDGLRRIAEDGVEPWQDTGLPPALAPKDPPVIGKTVTHMTPQQYVATLPEIFADGLKPMNKEMEWIIAVRVGQEIITLNLNTLYRERINRAPKESEVKRDGILMGLARKRYGSWEDLAEVNALSPTQVKALLSAAHGDRLEGLYVLAVHTGLRIGELLGLRWGDVDLEAGKLRVARQLQRVRGGGGLAFSPTKNSSRRTIKLTATAVEALRSHHARQAEERLKIGSLYRDQDLIFASTIGTPLEASNVMNRSFKPLLKRAGLPGIRFHDLRHTAATLLLSRGVHPKLVQELLGHATITQTMDTYSHVLPGMGDQTANAMESALSRTFGEESVSGDQI